jgi:hypothetical protein
VATASAAQVVRGALDALTPAPIVHVDVLGSQSNGDGSTVHWEDENWTETGGPGDVRQIETDNAGNVAESATVGGRDEVYDAARNTIYRAPLPRVPRYSMRAGAQPGSYDLTLPRAVSLRRLKQVIAGGGSLTDAAVGGTKTVTITAEQRGALLTGHATIAYRLFRRVGSDAVGERPYVAPVEQENATGDGFRGQARALLHSRGVDVRQHASVDGRPAIRIASADGHTVYFVAPRTYTPIELRTHGDGGGTTLRFRTYEELPDTPANRGLLSLTAQHPDARVDSSAAGYDAAQARLFPHG